MNTQKRLVDLVFRLGDTYGNLNFLEEFRPEVADNKEFDILKMAIDNKIADIKCELKKQELEARHV